MSNMIINADGSVTATVTVRFTGAVDALDTGTATLTITPEGGISTLSALLDGDPGQPANIRNVNVTILPPGSAGSGTATQVSPGGPGRASLYDLTISIPKGDKGDQGNPGTVLASSDISNSPADRNTLVYNASTKKAFWSAVSPALPYFVVPGSAFTSISATNATASGVIVSMQIPAQPFAYRPLVGGDTEIVSAVDTRVDTEVRIGAATQSPAQTAQSGTLVGRGRGQSSPNAFHVITTPFFGVQVTPGDTNPAAVIPAGVAQTIVFSAVRTTGTAPWSTSSAFGELRVKVEPA